MRTLRTALALALPLALLAGCGGAGAEPGEAAPGDRIAVEVQNNLVPPTSLTVWSVSDTGTRQMLGTVSPSETRTLRMSVPRLGSEYQLIAETTSGEEIVSRTFVMTGDVGAVGWDLTTNAVNLR